MYTHTKETQKHTDTQTHRHRNTETQRKNCTETQRHRDRWHVLREAIQQGLRSIDTYIHTHKTEAQKHRNTEARRHREKELQKHRDIETVGVSCEKPFNK